MLRRSTPFEAQAELMRTKRGLLLTIAACLLANCPDPTPAAVDSAGDAGSIDAAKSQEAGGNIIYVDDFGEAGRQAGVAGVIDNRRVPGQGGGEASQSQENFFS